MIRLSKHTVDCLMLHTQVTKENINNSVPIFLYNLLMSFWLRCEMTDALFTHQKPSYFQTYIEQMICKLSCVPLKMAPVQIAVHLSNTKELLLLCSC